MKDTSKTYLGVALLVIGSLLLLKNFGMLDLAFLGGLKPYWPAGLIFIGLGILLKRSWITAVAIGLMILVLISPGGSDRKVAQGLRDYTQGIEARPGIEMAKMDVNFGAGVLEIGKGKDSHIYLNRIESSEQAEPRLTADERGPNITLRVDRLDSDIAWGKDISEEWDIGLSSKVVYDIELNYGAADARIDISDLKVSDLDLKCGATSTEVKLGGYPTRMTIDTGASSILLKIPKDAGAVIVMDGGLVSTDFEDFRKEGSRYYSKAYDPNKDNLEITIHAGASSIDTELY